MLQDSRKCLLVLKKKSRKESVSCSSDVVVSGAVEQHKIRWSSGD